MGCNFGTPSDAKNVSPEQPICIKHFEVLRCLGVGAFGEVNAVRFKFHPSKYGLTNGGVRSPTSSSFDGDDDHLYALKRINKKKLAAKATSLAGTLVERELLEEFWSHEGVKSIVRMHASFQDSDTLYLVLDLMLGGSLDFHIGKGSFSTCDDAFVRFAAMELAQALDSLHAVGILHVSRSV
jgi:serine/threonine kinase 32